MGEKVIINIKTFADGHRPPDLVVPEDVFAESVVMLCLPQIIRKRIRILPIGSNDAVVRQLAARRMEKNDRCLCILDGDQKKELTSAIGKLVNYTEASTPSEKGEATEWAKKKAVLFTRQRKARGMVSERSTNKIGVGNFEWA